MSKARKPINKANVWSEAVNLNVQPWIESKLKNQLTLVDDCESASGRITLRVQPYTASSILEQQMQYCAHPKLRIKNPEHSYYRSQVTTTFAPKCVRKHRKPSPAHSQANTSPQTLTGLKSNVHLTSA
jgi:hypothetical protein